MLTPRSPPLSRALSEALAGMGAVITEVSIPEVRHGLPAYYLIAPAEASSNLARYDGVRYGLRVDGKDTEAMNSATRAAGFGAEVKRRVMLGTFALSSGYYDAYYGQAQRVRTIIVHALDAAYAAGGCAVGSHHTDTRVQARRQDRRPAGDVPVGPVHGPVEPGRTSRNKCSVRPLDRWPADRSAGPRAGTGRAGDVPGGGRIGARRRRWHATFGDGRVTAVSKSGDFEAVIGLEVHCELSTATKLFCGCKNEFGGEPNTQICPVCLGLPGSLPVLNSKAVELAMRIGTALNSEIRFSRFDRKNYFYPDMPKDYQISQYAEPINVGGHLDLPDGSRVGIVRAHIEEDTGKTTHMGGGGRIHDADYSLVDYNRAGVPLVEIVSEPDIRSAEQARLYAAELRGILVGTGASDGRMEEGSMRIDANVSVRRSGTSELGTRCEVKNLNSLRSLGRAIEYEIERQTEIVSGGGSVVQQTRHWDEQNGVTVALRSKEEAFDYRYFSEPDLVPVEPDPSWLNEVASALGPMPAERRAAVVESLGGEATPAQADQILTVVDLDLDSLVLAAVAAGVDPGLASTPHRQRGGRGGRARAGDGPGLVHRTAPDGAAGSAHRDAVEDRPRRDAGVGRGSRGNRIGQGVRSPRGRLARRARGAGHSRPPR